MRHNCCLERTRHLTLIITASTNYRAAFCNCLEMSRVVHCCRLSVDCVRICVSFMQAVRVSSAVLLSYSCVYFQNFLVA